MSRLRGNPQKHTCQQHLGYIFTDDKQHIGEDEHKISKGLCGEPAVIRCNACKEYFCGERWSDHWEMTVVVPA